MSYQESEGMQFDTEKLWAIAWVVAAFLSLASGGMLGALAFALLGLDSLKSHQRKAEDYMLPGAPQPIGDATRLGAIPTEATEVYEPFNPQDLASIPTPQPPRPEPQPPVAVHVPVNVHNHMGQQAKPTPKTASPAQSDRRTSAPDLSLYPDPRERMMALLKAMAQSGLPLGTLLKHPFVWCWGQSQSGKTTIALLLTIARMAMGYRVSYFSTDDDYPRNLPWSRVEDSPEGYAVALDDAKETISKASKHALKGYGWLIDEMFAAYTEHGIKIQPILKCVLMKGAKTGAAVIGISQLDTSEAHGLKGVDDAWRRERVEIEAIHLEDELGERFPTGRYVVRRGESPEEWIMPEWMLTEQNQWGHFDPVVWVLNRFPELTAAKRSPQPPAKSAPTPAPESPRSTRTASPAWTDAIAPLNELYDRAVSTPDEDGLPVVEKLANYLQKKEQIDFRTLEKNWGKNNGFQGDELRDLLTVLTEQKRVAVWGDGIIWKG